MAFCTTKWSQSKKTQSSLSWTKLLHHMITSLFSFFIPFFYFFSPLAPSFILKVFRLIAEIYKVISPCLDVPDSIYLLNLCLLSVMSNVLPILENEAQKKWAGTACWEEPEDSQGNFQIKAGHAQVLELGVSHKQLSHCGKSNELSSDSAHIKSRFLRVVRVLRLVFVVMTFMSVMTWRSGDRAHTRADVIHAYTNILHLH